MYVLVYAHVLFKESSNFMDNWASFDVGDDI